MVVPACTKVWNLFNIVSGRLNFFVFGMEFFYTFFYRRNFSVEILTVENITLLNVEKILS